MSLKKIIIIVCVLALFVIFFIIPRIIFSGAEFIEEFPDEEGVVVEDFEESNNISGEGTLTSFNIEKIDTSYWKNVDEVLFNDEDLVKANQLLLKTSNKESNGEISATIDGRIYVQEQSGKDMYYIYDLDNIGIEFKVSEEESVNLKIGQKAKITFVGSTESYEGVVYYIQKIPVDEEIAVKVKLEYNDNLKFGTNAKVEILLDEPVEENVNEFDIKNTTTKIGKTKIILKNSTEYSAQNFDMEALMEEYMSQMMEGMEFGEGDITDLEGLYGSQFEGELPFNFESENQTDVESLSKELSEQWNTYWNEYWSEYWKNYWKSYYEEYPIYIKEPNTENQPNDNTDEQEELEDENEDTQVDVDQNDDKLNNEEDDDTDNQEEGEE